MNLRPQGGDAGTRRWEDAEKNMVNIRHFRELRVYQAEDGQVRLGARLQDEIVWLT